uniref:Beta-glucosidase n=1 Tax=Neogobius melanostomus TaxID=47308 RepID=A0A8C6WXU5_9GOBI
MGRGTQGHTGNSYNPTMKTIIKERSQAAGLPKSRLPEFTPEEIVRIKGTHDCFCFNHYTTVLAFPVDYKNLQHYDADRGAGTIADRTWLDSGSGWLKVSPFGFRKILNFIKENYGNPPVIITENGVSERGVVDLNDTLRQYYYTQYINQVLKVVVDSVSSSAYLVDAVDIRGYTAWTLMDNLEWATGFEERFGLFYVNRSDPGLKRIPRASVQTYNRIIRCNGFPDPASGHECLTPPPPTMKPPGTPVLNVLLLPFLGVQLSVEEAEVGLNTTFALLVVACGAALLVGVGFCIFRRRQN